MANKEFEELHVNHAPEKNSKMTKASELFKLIWFMAIFRLKAEVKRNSLSYCWWILEPLLHLIVFYVVFGLLLKRGDQNFMAFLMTGLLPFMWFSKTISNCGNCIEENKNIILQSRTSIFIFPCVSIIQNGLKQIPIFLLLLSFVWLQGFHPNSLWWALIPLICVEALIIMAFAFVTAAIIPFIRDLSNLIPTALSFCTFISGIFYSYKNIAPQWQSLFLLNPMAFILKSYREILIYGIWPDFTTLCIWGLIAAAICTLVLVVFDRLYHTYTRLVME